MANADSGSVEGLPLARSLYPEESVSAAAAAFAEPCRVQVDRASAETPLATIAVLPDHLGESRRVVGEFLNALVILAVERTLGRVGGVRP